MILTHIAFNSRLLPVTEMLHSQIFGVFARLAAISASVGI